MKRTANTAFSPVKLQRTIAIYFPENGELALHAYVTRHDSFLEARVRITEDTMGEPFPIMSLDDLTDCLTTIPKFYGAYVFVYDDGRVPRITIAYGDGFKSMFSQYSSINSVAKRVWEYVVQ